jgi:ankyrin repeat protein
MTALHHAAKYGFAVLVSCLLQHGADTKSLSNSGQTPLLTAAAVAHDPGAREWEDVIKQLLDDGADINHADDKSCTALIYAARNGHESIVRLLLERGASVDQAEEDAERNGWTALVHAAQNGFESIVRLLIDHNADVNKSGGNGDTAVLYAARNGYAEIVRTLLEKGAVLPISQKITIHPCSALNAVVMSLLCEFCWNIGLRS